MLSWYLEFVIRVIDVKVEGVLRMGTIDQVMQWGEVKDYDQNL